MWLQRITQGDMELISFSSRGDQSQGHDTLTATSVSEHKYDSDEMASFHQP